MVEASTESLDPLGPFVALTTKLIALLDVPVDLHIERINTAIFNSQFISRSSLDGENVNYVGIESQRTLFVLGNAVKLAIVRDITRFVTHVCGSFPEHIPLQGE